MEITAQQVAPQDRHNPVYFSGLGNSEAIAKLAKEVQKFLGTHLNGGERLLLGFSGGNDSRLLLHLLLICQKKSDFTFDLAHLDHGWRASSHQEALDLAELAHSLNLVFYTERATLKKGSEDEARIARYQFFKRLYFQNSYDGLLLAHHADDQAETILKRVFEGAHLSSLGGMKPITHVEGMRLMRPLLMVSKQELQQSEIKGIQDETNLDSKFLRGRMRASLFPTLSQLFGKEVKSSLLRLGRYAQELEEFFTQFEPYYQVSRGPFGLLVDFCVKERALIRFALHKLLKEEGLEIGGLLTSCIDHLLKKSANCKLHPRLFVDRGRCFLLKRPLPSFKKIGPLVVGQEKIFQENRWQWKIALVEKLPLSVESKEPLGGSGWRHFWSGEVILDLPEGVDFACVPACFRSKEIDKRWTEAHVPAFLRDCLPLITDGITKDRKIIGELLSGQKPQEKCKFSICIQIIDFVI